MGLPITTLVKQRKSSKFPVNQEVTKNADGTGGPVSIAKQTKYKPQSEPKNRKEYKQRQNQYKKDPYQKAVDKFPQFNQKTDTIISTTSGNYNLNKMINLTKAKNAATNLYDGNSSNSYRIKKLKGPKDSVSYYEDNGMKTTTYDLYDKNELKKSVSTPAKKKDACYHKAKAKYDVFPSAYASGYIATCRKKKGKLG